MLSYKTRIYVRVCRYTSQKEYSKNVDFSNPSQLSGQHQYVAMSVTSASNNNITSLDILNVKVEILAGIIALKSYFCDGVH